MTTEIDGVLRNWGLIPCSMGPTKTRAVGDLHGDTKGRFFEGAPVTTSYIVSGPDADGIIHTRNSVYRLEPFPASAPQQGDSAT